eukprot:CAMPEP_0197187262 /NCGR_PEP_ID=MMETSP1423-20130617/15565_1 /TAXON_ID=476441 /ORGANISM="Pseudo-nitzschia heimii, Strain UNC1101" /LENGTH=530 /DNA_ID=CAMNT_0042638803 /DNA_START=37 /DNA_END=1629 /DNA_ORIENTATION=-
MATTTVAADNDPNNATMTGVMDAKELDASSESSETTEACSGSGSDSEDFPLSEVGSEDERFPTGLKQRRKAATKSDEAAGGVEVVSDSLNDDPTARADSSRSKYNRSSATETSSSSKNIIVSISEHGEPYTFARWLEFFVGCVFFFVPLPLVVCQIVICTLWEGLDKLTLKLTDKATRLNEWCGRNLPLYEKLVQHPRDTFVVNTTIWLAGCLPAFFFFEAYAQAQSIAAGDGFIWWRAAVYNIVRIGPMYCNFMYVYVLCHKEAHSNGKLFALPYRDYAGLKYIYNYFIGFFHGVIPGPFTVSHIYNHHKYDNDCDDVYSTGAYPRDSFLQYLRYVYVFFLYALNISSIRKFYSEGLMDKTFSCVAGSLYFAFGLFLCAKFVSPLFALMYVFYPFVEANILLSAVNYTWHAFIDPDDPDNDYVNSTTILDAMNFTLDEEYHVVHHQYSGIHWSKNQELYDRHIEDYKKCTATVFQGTNIFVIWGMIINKDYDGLCDFFVQYEEDESKRLSRDDLKELLKTRLRCTTWSY